METKYKDFEFPDWVKERGNFKSIKTCFERVTEGARDLIVDSEAYTYAGKYRRIQLDTTAEEFDTIVKLCEGKDKPGRYFATITSKANLEKTLLYVRRLLARSVEAISFVTKKIKNTTKGYINFVADKIAEGKYSMANVVAMVEYASTKKQPDRYLIGILKKGFVPYSAKKI